MNMSSEINNRPTQRITAVDLGTNSFHAVIVDIYPDGSFRTIDKLKEMVLLGSSQKNNRLSEDAMERGLDALRKIKTLSDHQGAEKMLAYATSAIREAENGGTFIQRMIDELGLKAWAISGKMEAELIYHAVQHAIALDDKPVLMADVGGGSVEFIIGNRKQYYFLASKKIGVARMTNRFVEHDPIAADEIAQMENYYRQQLTDVAEAFAQHRTDTLVGSSGTMENISEIIARRQDDKPSLSLNEFEYTANEFKEFYEDFISYDREKRSNVKGLDDKRVDIIFPGLVLVKLLIEMFGIKRIKTSDQALREGIILRYIKKEMDDLKLMADFPNPRKRSVYELLRKYNWHREHSLHVSELALKLFDELQPIHQLDENDRELLEYASLMHDIGYHISRRKHHKHALYLIRNADMKGFKEDEIEVMANVARYHRRSTPKSRHKYYDRLDKETKRRIRKMSGLLRVADGLDRSHYQNVHQLDVEIQEDKITLHLQTESDPELEIWGAERKSELFEETMGRELSIEPEPRFAVVD